MNLLGPELVRDLVSLIQHAEADACDMRFAAREWRSSRSSSPRSACFPAAAAASYVAVKERVNAITLAPADDFRRDSDLFGEGAREPEAKARIAAAIQSGLQTRDAELDIARVLG